MYFFKDTNGNWIIGESVDSIVSKVPCELRKSSPTTVAVRTVESRILLLSPTEVTAIKKNAEGDFYANYAEFVEGVSGFFVNAPLDGAVINLEPGQYLSDVVQTITGATLENPVTINFYNHSKTVNWETFTEKIHWPLHVYLNFVGKINLWPNTYYPRMGFNEGLLISNPTDKLFLGFSFDRTNDDSVIKVSGLPENVQKVFFGGLDQSYQIAESYQNLLDDPDDWGFGTLGLVRVKGSKADDIRNDALYKKIGNNFIDVTPNFQYVDFIGNYLQFSYFYSANCQSANFGNANCQSANFGNANCQSANFGNANCQGANFDSANNQGANFGYANNQYAIFGYANNQYAIFGYANNQGANFGYANNQWANFYFANNQGAYFGFANNQGANFYSANNQGAYFDYANNQGANFYSANNQGASFSSANNQGANFNYANNQWASFSSANNQVASFISANNQDASFGSANLKDVNWDNVISIENANFQNADLTGGVNLPERINTKAKWIAECGAGNVNAETIWIDGTSILS